MAPADSVPGTPKEAPSPEPGRLLSATLPCETCGRDTPHRILRLVSRPGAASGDLRGIARCRECRWTHPFEVVGPSSVEVTAVVSEGPRSEPRRASLPRGRRVQVGTGVPGSSDGLRIHRIETRSGRSVPEALAEEVSTLWVTRNVGAVVPVSIVEGARTRTVKNPWPPETLLEVGARIRLDRTDLFIVGLRAHGRTWRRPGDRFPAREVGRVYARRTEIPPAGRRDWSSGRGMPSSRTSSISRSDRSRSGPGVSRTRTVPRRRTASLGAAVHRRSPS
jgi:uncharacterized Zn finger protein